MPVQLRITNISGQLVPAIKAVRAITGGGLKETKDLLDSESWFAVDVDRVWKVEPQLALLHEQGVQFFYRHASDPQEGEDWP